MEEKIRVLPLPYHQARKSRVNRHEIFGFLEDYPLSVIDDLINVIDGRLADADEFVLVRRKANEISKRVRGLGYFGASELMARVGYLLSHEE